MAAEKHKIAGTGRALLKVAAATVAVGVAAYVTRGPERAPSAPKAAVEAPAQTDAPLRFAWEPGARYVYSVRWTASSQSMAPALGSGPVAGSVRLAGELYLSALGSFEGRTVFSASLTDVTEHAVDVMGTSAIPDDEAARATFEGREAWMSVGADGHLANVYFRKDAPATFMHLMQAVLAHTQLDLGDGVRAAWTASESTPTGTSSVAYEVTGQSPTTISRTRTRYETIAAVGGGCTDCAQHLVDHGAAVLDPAGFVRALDESETLTATRAGETSPALVSHDEFSARWLRTEHFTPPTDVTIDPSTVVALGPGEVVASQHAQDAALAQRVGTMTAAAMLGGIDAYASTGQLVSRDFVWRASGLVLEHPEIAAQLARKIEAAGTSAAGRALALDVLASAGSSAGQAAMREALASPAVRADAGYPQLLQRFSMIKRPDPDSVRFVSDAMASRDARARTAATYSLGALVGASNDPAVARTYGAKLDRALLDARTPADKATYLHAVGNATHADDGHLGTLRAYAKDADPGVRAAAAAALRHDGSTEARAALDALVADGDPHVQEAALSSLDQGTVTAQDLRALSSEVTSGGVAAQNEGGLVTFLAKHAGDDPDSTKQMLGYLLQQANARTDRTASVRIRTLLAQMM
jgi:hypothetical protein